MTIAFDLRQAMRHLVGGFGVRTVRLGAVAQGARLDKRPWTRMAGLTGAPGDTTARVGTPDQVAEATLDCYDLGIDTIRGFDALADAVHDGRDLRAPVGERDARYPRAVAAE